MPAVKVTVRIRDLARGGAGVARDDSGRVIFVPYTAPGDLVEVEITEAKKNFAQARLAHLLEPSPQRVTPRCPVFTRCGGCQWQHLPYELQWQTKVTGVRQVLGRARVAVPESGWDEYPAQRIWEYRNRVQARGFQDELGFHAAGTRQRVAVDGCAIARPEINARWAEIRSAGAGLLQPYKVEIEVTQDGTVRESWNAQHAALGFRQVHDEQNETMKEWVAGQLPAEGAGPRTLYDLYGGSGNLSRDLAGRFHHIHCVDVSAPENVADGPGSATTGHYTFHRSDVARWIARQPKAVAPADASAILDPPREGLGDGIAAIAEGLGRLGVSELVLISCDADAFARDLGGLQGRGWTVARVAVFDLFPHTPHVESGALVLAPKPVAPAGHKPRARVKTP
jgi:23S rRNA (uracil1939-C5)-methyltransferase